MKNFNIVAFVLLLILISSAFYGCDNSSTTPNTTTTEVGSELSTEASEENLELEIITIPQDVSDSEIFTEDSSQTSEKVDTSVDVSTSAHSDSTEPNPTEEQKIELPFIPAD